MGFHLAKLGQFIAIAFVMSRLNCLVTLPLLPAIKCYIYSSVHRAYVGAMLKYLMPLYMLYVAPTSWS